MLLAASRRFVLAGSRVALARRLLPAQRDLGLVLRSRGRTLASTRSGLTLRERATRWLERRRLYRVASSLASKWWIRRPLRAGRYVVLGGVLFASGREIGSIEYANDPVAKERELLEACLLYTSPSPRDRQKSRMPSSA